MLLVLFFLFAFNANGFSQSRPYKNGIYDFGVFDLEYGRTTARCRVTIKEDFIIAVVTKNLYGDIYKINQIIYSGVISKVGKFYYIIEDGSTPLSNDEFTENATRIDFKRGFILHP